MTSVGGMELLRWDERPQLRRPALVAAFEGWNDAGNAASEAVAFLSREWAGEAFAAFDSEELFDFTSSRPQAKLEGGETRRLSWPELKLAKASPPSVAHDVVFLSGPEPQLRWRSFADELRKTVGELGIDTAVLVGALLADVPHTRPVRVSGGSTVPELASRACVEPSYYEGPTGIVGVVSDLLAKAGIPTLSLWASVPHYVSQSVSPKATLALVERTLSVIGGTANLAELQISAAAYERQVNELVASDEDASAYVKRLEEQDEEAHPSAHPSGRSFAGNDTPRLSPASGEHLAAEAEHYLREHRRE
ncbi:MAG: PAC2 family protein [Acidimicrobiales bacterium]